MSIRRSSGATPVAAAAAPNYAEIEVSDGWKIDFRGVDFIIAGVPKSLGAPTRGGKYACSVRVAERFEKLHSRVFAFVKHPDHGLIAVSPKEFEALGLQEVVVRD